MGSASPLFSGGTSGATGGLRRRFCGRSQRSCGSHGAATRSARMTACPPTWRGSSSAGGCWDPGSTWSAAAGRSKAVDKKGAASRNSGGRRPDVRQTWCRGSETRKQSRDSASALGPDAYVIDLHLTGGAGHELVARRPSVKISISGRAVVVGGVGLDERARPSRRCSSSGRDRCHRCGSHRPRYPKPCPGCGRRTESGS